LNRFALSAVPPFLNPFALSGSSPVCCATPGLKALNQEIDNSIDPGVSGVLFLAEKRDGGTQGRSFFFEKTEGVKKPCAAQPRGKRK